MHRLLVLSLIGLNGLAVAADVSSGTATAHPGQKATGFIQVPAGVDAATGIPVILVNGARPGPTLAIVAGAHGTEFASIIALEKLAQAADPAAMSGALIIVPLMNIAAFTQKVPHLNPVDGKNMNRMWPGKPDGTQTERVSWAVSKQVVEKCDYLIDLHGGDLDENLRQYSYWPKTGNPKLDAPSRGMVLAFGFDHIIIQINQPNPPTVSISRFAEDSGKPTIIAEAGHAGTTEAGDIDVLVQGCFNVMRHLKMMAGTVKPVEHPLWIGPVTVVASDQDGIFYGSVVPEAYVFKGAKLGYITDYFGNVISEVTAPVAGVIVYVCSVPSMKKGNTVAYVGEISAAP
jgi:predicted deacylase